jgi:hypothetical protein
LNRGVTPRRSDGTTPTHDAALLQALQRLEMHRAHWNAVQVFLSRMRSNNKLDYQIRIAANTFETAVNALEGQLYKLTNGDLFFIYRKTQDISPVLQRLHYLLDDEISLSEDEENGFFVVYELGTTYNQAIQAVQQIIERHQRPPVVPVMQEPEATTPLDLKSLKELIDALARADLSNFIRKQTVYALLSGKPSVPLFAEKFISIEDLRRQLLPSYNLAANRWLFQYMTESLDKRMLHFLLRNAATEITGAFSLNLNVSTVLAPEFLAFDAGLTVGMRGAIVIELQAVDIIADMNAYNTAKVLLADRGYRICLDGITARTYPYIDRKRLEADFVKLQWSPLLDGNTGESRKELADWVERSGRVCTILCRVDQEEAINFGRALGIALYQGRYLDRMASSVTRPPR